MAHYNDVIDDLKEPTHSLGQAIPDTWNGFNQLHKAAVADGALPAKDSRFDPPLSGTPEGRLHTP